MTTKIEGARPFVNTYAAIKCREMRERKREYIYEKLGYSSCKMCGCNSNLEFDHINPALKTTQKFLRTLSYGRIDNELYNIQLLCRSCHRKRNNNSRCNRNTSENQNRSQYDKRNRNIQRLSLWKFCK